MKSSRFLIQCFLIVSLLYGCTTATSNPSPISPTSTATQPAEPAAVLLRIRLSTTSDWTEMVCISGADLTSYEAVSASQEATTAEVSDGYLLLQQPVDQASAGESVEMTVDMLFSAREGGGAVTFKIERGDIGATQVEISKDVGGEWVVIQTASWDGITGDGANAHTVEIAAEALFGEVASPTSVPQPLGEANAVSPVTGMPQGTDGYPWWNDSVFYEIYVRSFYDSDGDGIGDFNGILEKLDYLNDGDPDTSTDLGITGIWLMPIFPSPSAHGYNVTDFYTVNPQFGTMDDFKNLLAAAHGRGMRVILDITLNHISTQHPWFIQGTDPASPYHDWFTWSDTDPGYLGYWEQQVWFPAGGKFFYSTFSANFADLNYNNPEVNAEMQNVARFWLDEVGVDGFRLDAAKHIIEEGTNQGNTASTHAWWEDFRLFYKQVDPQAMLVGEIWDTTALTAEYLQGDEFDLSFDFYLAGNIIQSVNDGDASAASDQLELSYTTVPTLMFAPFLANHDQNRIMSQFFDDPDKVKVAASLMLTAPGTPFLYYGEEVGLQGDVPGDENRRPMQWSTDAEAGFTSGTPWKPIGPGWESYNVARETDDPASILSHYRNLIWVRNQHAALRVGDLNVVSTSNNALYSILRVSQEEAVLLLINLSGGPVTDYQLNSESSLLAEGSYSLYAIMGEGEFASLPVTSGGGFSGYVPVAKMPPYATFILQLQRDQ